MAWLMTKVMNLSRLCSVVAAMGAYPKGRERVTRNKGADLMPTQNPVTWVVAASEALLE